MERKYGYVPRHSEAFVCEIYSFSGMLVHELESIF